MKMTNMTRDAILINVLDHAFKEREEAIGTASTSLADRIQAYVLKDCAGALEKVPKGFLRISTDILCTFNGHQEYLHATKESAWFVRHSGWVADPKVKAENAFITEWAKLEKKARDIKEERKAARNNARALLYSVTTEVKLLEVWPEVKAFIPASAASMLPVPIKQLNKTLGLP